MKRVLVVTRNFPPLWGGMERLNLNLVLELSKYFQVRLIAPFGAEKHCPKTVETKTAPLNPLYHFLGLSALKTIQQAIKWQPHYIIAGSGLTAPHVWIAAKFCGAKTIVYSHGLDMAVTNYFYKLLWHPTLRRIDTVIANSNPTARLAKHNVGINAKNIHILHPGVRMPKPVDKSVNPSRQQRKISFCKRHNIRLGPLLLSVGRLTQRKGLREFVRDVLPVILERFPNASLVIIGDTPTDSLLAGTQSVESIKQEARYIGAENNVHFVGKKFGDELAEAFQSADVHVFPVKDIPNDPEGFGMVAIEAAAHGLPTIAYATGGIIDAVKPEISGILIPPGDHEAFSDAIDQQLHEPLDTILMQQFAAGFAWEGFGIKLRHILETAS